MKRVIKIYMLLQLLSLPFVIASFGRAFDSADGTTSVSGLTGVSAVSATAAAQDALCDAILGEVTNAVQDDIQQLRYITAHYYGDDIAEDCFATPPAGMR
jgi:hypothetical protein